MALFSPYDVERVMGRPFADVSISEDYRNMVDDGRIGKTYIDAREFFMTLAELQFESGYPYMVFEDTCEPSQPDRRTNCHEQLVLGDPPSAGAKHLS